MFRNINKTIAKKYTGIIRSETSYGKINKILDDFLIDTYNKNTAQLEIETQYDTTNKRMIIKTSNKSLATDLTLRAGDLNKKLHENEVFLNQIVVK